MSRRQGFTLVELVVVVLILGILAAIAAPKIFSNTNEAADSGVMQTLASVRDAVELYKAQNGTYPQPSDSDELHTMLNAYLRGTVFPKVTVANKNSNAVVLDTDDDPTVTAGSEGWVYSKSTGEIIINSSDALSSNASVNYNQL
jgi:general secretion pathway protein G